MKNEKRDFFKRYEPRLNPMQYHRRMDSEEFSKAVKEKGYQSPIEIIWHELQMKMDADILTAVQSYDIRVDKEELLRALAYDRDQYAKGASDKYLEMIRDGYAPVVRCKDCTFFEKDVEYYPDGTKDLCRLLDRQMLENDFCSYGEAKDGKGDERLEHEG